MGGKCNVCGTEILETPEDCITWCKHQPEKQSKEVAHSKFFERLKRYTAQLMQRRP